MKKWIRALGLACALALLGGAALGEDMPIVTDEPLTAEEASAAEVERMRQAQQMLIDLGLLQGAADGIFGPKTAEALYIFQARNGLEASGVLNEPTMAALREKSKIAGEAREIQQRLIDLGYLSGTADGIFGDRSAAALKLFQVLAGLKGTGKMDDATREALFADDARAVPARLRVGDKSDEVTALQERLALLGFMSGRIDGSYGKATAAAVQRFQEHLLAQGVDADLGITANGEATPATQALLFDPGYSSYLRDIAPGDEGSEALRVERRLNRLGYMDADPDEAFDDYAAAAVSAFRTANGLGEGDTVDQATIDALFAEDAAQAETFVPHAIAREDEGLAVQAVEAALQQSGMLIQFPSGYYGEAMTNAVQRVHDYLAGRDDANAALLEDPAALSVEAQAYITGDWLDVPVVGDDSDTVMRVQRRLHTLYYLPRGYIDGQSGAITYEAIKEFQADHGLPETGEDDAATRAALFARDTACKAFPYRVEVSIDDQRVYIYERDDAGEYALTHTFICSTGTQNRTPRGIFLDGFPANVWHYFKKFNCWAKYSFVIEGDIMFHSVLFSSDDVKTLRSSSYYNLGSKASHGCIRLKVEDAKWLFTHCKRGTVVIVIY